MKTVLSSTSISVKEMLVKIAEIICKIVYTKTLCLTIVLFVFSYDPIVMYAQDSNDIKIMELINQERTKYDAPPLKYDKKLDSIANEWVSYIAQALEDMDYVSLRKAFEKDHNILHVNFKNRCLIAGYFGPFTTYSEICAATPYTLSFPSNDTVTHVFTQWKNSPSHHESMVNKNMTHFGYACILSRENRVHYITVFGRTGW